MERPLHLAAWSAAISGLFLIGGGAAGLSEASGSDGASPPYRLTGSARPDHGGGTPAPAPAHGGEPGGIAGDAADPGGSGALEVIGAEAPGDPARRCPGWRFVRLEQAGPGVLGQITVAASGSAWATGDRNGRPVLFSWNGIRWRAATGTPLPTGFTLTDVSAASAHDVWAVGHRPADGTVGALRWNGERWGAVPMDRAGPSTARSITAGSPDDVWAVGTSSGFAGTMATAWRWDGRALRTVPVPLRVTMGGTGGERGTGGGLNSELVSVSATGAGQIWAVGSHVGHSPAQLIVHWNGREWTGSAPPPVAGPNALTDVAALGPDDVWAVGWSAPENPGPEVPDAGRAEPAGLPADGDLPLAEHWDGRSWSRIPVPDVRGRFQAVTSDGEGGVWAAGISDDERPLLAHWTGSSWEYARARVPEPGGNDEDVRGPGGITGLATVPGTSYVWAAGWYGAQDRTDTRRYPLTWTNMPRPR